MSSNMLLYVIYVVGGIFAVIVFAYFLLAKKMGNSDYQQIKRLRQGTERGAGLYAAEGQEEERCL